MSGHHHAALARPPAARSRRAVPDHRSGGAPTAGRRPAGRGGEASDESGEGAR